MALTVDDLSLAELDPAGRRAVCQALVKRARREVGKGRERGEPGAPLLEGLSAAYDEMIRALADGAVRSESALSVVALGGFGRREVYPYSDIDLLVLHEGVAEAELDELVTKVVYPLWDAGVSVGHAVRGIDQALDLAATDLTMQTALLDARLVVGDEGPFHALTAGAYREFFGPQQVNRFVAQLAEERARRHARFGETVYLLEPNIKSNKGGLRDINTALWAAKARFGVTSLAQLPELEAATPRQAAAIEEAHEFLRGLRTAMHLHTGRMQDQLLFALQEELGPQLFPEEEMFGLRRRTTQAVAPAVERLMHALYRHLRTVVVESEGILERCCVPDERRPRPPRVDPIDDHFSAIDGCHLGSVKPETFWERPAELLRAFELGIDRRLPLDRATRDAIAEAAAGEPGAQLYADDEAPARFLSLLSRPDGGDTLQLMHDIGLIAAMIPEFEPCTGRIQHDLYHVYTVDQHTLLVVGLLHALARGELADRYERPVDVMAEITGDEAVTLYLSALLHDVAKPLGSGHSEKGARLSAGVAARLGLSHAQQDEVAFIVREHLTMAHISQRRDLSDPEVVGSFAALVGSGQRLRKLYLLTVADTAMTRPGNLTEWKASLLDDLYVRTLERLEHGERAHEVHTEKLEKRRDALEEHLQEHEGEAGRRLARRVPERLIGARDIDELRHQLKAVLQLEAAPGELAHVIARERDITVSDAEGADATAARVVEITIACEDRPGLLSIITGVMLANRIQVLSAQAYTFEADEEHALPGGVLDIFLTQPPLGSANEAIDAFRQQLSAVMRGDLDIAPLVADAMRQPNLPRRVVPQVHTEVRFDNAGSRECTILELQAPDRLGLLHAVTSALAEMDLDVQLAMITTESGRVVDSFYLKDRESGAKIADTERLAAIGERLDAAVEALGG
ncbi:MAG: [protein-PII] uridylyltransferase [Myxococcales bacterium]|nr:[protein-PII] uridylyltransferase [Myxococcales bacterium]